jgi:ATPase subunit of ABC transporter with duplicated ATPase domains
VLIFFFFFRVVVCAPLAPCPCPCPRPSGKSTLLKLLTKQHFPTDGKIVEHPKYTLAYFGQYSTHELDLEKTAAEWMGVQFPGEQAGALRQHLAKTSIVGAVQDTRMEALSFSQKSCIVFSKLTFKCPHLLILDEPTNFLDLESVDSLIAACNKYAGALLLVSHNRDFLKKVRHTARTQNEGGLPFLTWAACARGGPRPGFFFQPIWRWAFCPRLALDC